MIVEPHRPDYPKHPPPQYGVIFIDCWEFEWHWQGLVEFYPGIKKVLSQLPISHKAFNTTCLNTRVLHLDTINYISQFVANHPNQLKFLNDFLNNIGDQNFASELWCLLDHQSHFVGSREGFSELVGLTGLQHWIVMGAHWGICIHNKPLGFRNLHSIKSKHPHIEFYAHPMGIAKWRYTLQEKIAETCAWEDFYKDDLNWSRFHHGLARLEIDAKQVQRPQIHIETMWPESIINHGAWEITQVESNRSMVEGLLPGQPGYLERCAQYNLQHKKYHSQYVLFVVAPDEIDLGRLLCNIDEVYSAFIDEQWRFILIKRGKNYKSRFLHPT